MAKFEMALRKVLEHEGVKFNKKGEVAKTEEVPLLEVISEDGDLLELVVMETGYSEHPDDPGGQTNYGITKLKAAEHGYREAMRLIPFELVKTIYRKDFWNKLFGDLIEDQQVAEELFDTAVNINVPPVVLFLQRTLNVLNKKGTLYPDIKTDGVCGPVTIATLNKAIKASRYHLLCILRALDSLQCVYYIKLAEQNEKFETFVPGWLANRVGVKD